MPVIERLQAAPGRQDFVISIDTSKAVVAERALAAGAQVVNDVSGARDPDMFQVVADRNAGIILMHMQGRPQTMQDEPIYSDVVEEVVAYCEQRLAAAQAAGVDPQAVILDPGIGVWENF